jgi:hypothetical protein
MRDLIVPAALVAVVTVLLEGIAVSIGWSPAAWVLVTLPIATGVAAFLVAGRLRALRLQARRRARSERRRTAGARSATVRRLAPETAAAAVTGDHDGRPAVRRV